MPGTVTWAGRVGTVLTVEGISKDGLLETEGAIAGGEVRTGSTRTLELVVGAAIGGGTEICTPLLGFSSTPGGGCSVVGGNGVVASSGSWAIACEGA